MSREVEYTSLAAINGPLVFVENVQGRWLRRTGGDHATGGQIRLGQVVEVDEGRAVVQVFEGTAGLSLEGTATTFLGKAPRNAGVAGDAGEDLRRPGTPHRRGPAGLP